MARNERAADGDVSDFICIVDVNGADTSLHELSAGSDLGRQRTVRSSNREVERAVRGIVGRGIDPSRRHRANAPVQDPHEVRAVTWGLLFRVRQTLKGSLWVLPILGGLLGLALGLADPWLERIGTPGWDYSASTALTVLTTVVGASVGLTGFVVTVSILVVQMATGTFSARYMRIWYRDPILKAVLAVLAGTFIFSYSLLRQVEGASVPNVGVTLAGLFLGSGLLLFLVFLDRVVHRLRPVKVAALVAHAGRDAQRAMAAAASRPHQADTDAQLEQLRAAAPSLVVHAERPGAIQAIHLDGLVGWATRNDCTLILLHATGDFVSTGVRTLEVYGTPARQRLDAKRLHGMIALGTERTIEQDPAFALRVMVDVAIRALSAAVNDPTTAIQVIDHLEDTLTLIGTTPGLTGRWEFRDDAGTLRLVMPARRFDDFLTLAVTEIRQYGAASIQVVRRLRAMLDTLRETVLSEYTEAVDDELERLNETITQVWGESPDHARVARADRQGIGGPRPLDT